MTARSMNRQVIPIAVHGGRRLASSASAQAPKGRRVDAGALEEVQRLLGDASRQRDLLIEHLHKIQDRFGHLSAAHLAALAQEMRLAQTEVYEVASFYHHFDIVKEGEARAAGADGARVRRPVVRDGRRARPAGAAARAARQGSARASPRRASAAASRRRRWRSGQNPVPQRELRRGGRPRSTANATRTQPERLHRLRRATSAQGGYALLQGLHRRASATSNRSSRRSKTRACAAWAAPASRPGASGASCAPSRRRA